MTNKKKIAIVISHVIQHFIHLYENWSLNNDWDTKVFFGSKAGMEEYYDHQFQMNIKWESRNLLNINHNFIKDTSTHPDEDYEKGIIEQSLEQFDPDFVLIYGYSQTLQRRAKSWANRNGVKIIYFGDSELRHSRNLFKLIVKKIFLNYYFKNIDFFLTTGNSNEEYLLNYCVSPEKFIRSSYPIDIKLYETKWNSREILNSDLRNKYDISFQEIVICMVGKFVHWKRQIDIIKALVLLDSELNTRINLILVGTGELENDLRLEAQKCKKHSVIFQGFVTPEKLPDFYAATDIYIHASEIEPHSVAVSEATFMGCPILISDKCGSFGTNDDVQIGINGFVYECGNIIKLAGMISYLINNNRIRESFSKKSHEITSLNQRNAHFDTLSTLKVIDDMGKNVLSPKRNGT